MNREKVILIVDDDETDCEELEELISDMVRKNNVRDKWLRCTEDH